MSASPYPVIAVMRLPEPIIYWLIDPREPERVRYVGQTTQVPELRLAGHFLEFTGESPKAIWLRELMASGVTPAMVLLQTVGSRKRLDRCEGEWMLRLFACGQADLNERVPGHVLAAHAQGLGVHEMRRYGNHSSRSEARRNTVYSRKPCARCGAEFQPGGPRSLFCEDCR